MQPTKDESSWVWAPLHSNVRPLNNNENTNNGKYYIILISCALFNMLLYLLCLLCDVDASWITSYMERYRRAVTGTPGEYRSITNS